jgi:hypothetical protein
LVELLIVIAIISVLATMSVAMLSGASQDAKISATQARISQITAMLQLQMEDYEVRRLPIPNRVLDAFIDVNRMPFNGTGPQNDRIQLKYLRRQLLMALIDSEMPRPVRALSAGQSIGYEENLQAGQIVSTFNLEELSTAAETNGLKNVDESDPPAPADFGMPAPTFFVWIRNNYPNDVSGVQLEVLLDRVTSSNAEKFQRAIASTTAPNEVDLPGEYLHEILRSIQIDGQSAVEMLGGSAIGDFDNDGIPEVVDAWGEPLFFDIEQFGATVDTTDNSVRSNDLGTVPLDPRYPMALGDLRIVVGSDRIPETLPVIERIAKGVE